MIKNITINEYLLFEILRRQLDSMEEGQSASATLFLMKEQILENAERETVYTGEKTVRKCGGCGREVFDFD